MLTLNYGTYCRNQTGMWGTLLIHHNKSLLSFPAIIFWDKTSYTFYLPKNPQKLQGINQEAKELSHINVYTFQRQHANITWSISNFIWSRNITKWGSSIIFFFNSKNNTPCRGRKSMQRSRWEFKMAWAIYTDARNI